jgi:hypothetical protein
VLVIFQPAEMGWATAFSIQVLTETWQQSGIFFKKMPPMRNSKRQHMDRKRSKTWCLDRIRMVAYPEIAIHFRVERLPLAQAGRLSQLICPGLSRCKASLLTLALKTL